MTMGYIPTSSSTKSDAPVAERLADAMAEIDRLRAMVTKRHVLSVVHVTSESGTNAPPYTSGDVSWTDPTTRNPFRLDDKPVSIKWTKSGLRIGCHTVTREALDVLARLEE